jgi:hypothetical protein
VKKVRVACLTNHALMVEANKQPGYGRRVQLIPDGLGAPLTHLERALTLKHPYSESDTLKGDHFNALAAMNQLPESINRARLARWENGRVFPHPQRF